MSNLGRHDVALDAQSLRERLEDLQQGGFFDSSLKEMLLSLVGNGCAFRTRFNQYGSHELLEPGYIKQGLLTYRFVRRSLPIHVARPCHPLAAVLVGREKTGLFSGKLVIFISDPILHGDGKYLLGLSRESEEASWVVTRVPLESIE